jgi:hypothetical protein
MTYNRFQDSVVGFDPHRPYQESAKFTLIRLPLLTSYSSICAQVGGLDCTLEMRQLGWAHFAGLTCPAF